jgi:hypothetical protein
MGDRPGRPAVPRAKRIDLPRPYEHTDTGPLLDKAKEITDDIKTMQDSLDVLLKVRGVMLLELERRLVSYRAIGRHIGVSHVNVKKICVRAAPPAPKPPVA